MKKLKIIVEVVDSTDQELLLAEAKQSIAKQLDLMDFVKKNTIETIENKDDKNTGS